MCVASKWVKPHTQFFVTTLVIIIVKFPENFVAIAYFSCHGLFLPHEQGHWRPLKGYCVILIGLPSHLSTVGLIYSCSLERKKVQAICLLKYFCLLLGLLESRISEKTNEGLGRKPNLGQPMSMKDHFGLKILHIMFMKCEILEGDVNPIPRWMVAVWAKLS